MEALKIIAASWPIAIMVLGSMIASVVLYIVRCIKQTAREDKASRATQAMVVHNRDNADA